MHPSYLGGLSRINRNLRGRPARCPQHAPRIFESGWLVPREWLYVGAIEDASPGQQICRHCSTNAKISSDGGSHCNTGFGNRNTAPQRVCDAASSSGENDGEVSCEQRRFGCSCARGIFGFAASQGAAFTARKRCGELTDAIIRQSSGSYASKFRSPGAPTLDRTVGNSRLATQGARKGNTSFCLPPAGRDDSHLWSHQAVSSAFRQPDRSRHHPSSGRILVAYSCRYVEYFGSEDRGS